MKFFMRCLDRLINLLSIILMSSLVLVTFFQVCNRYILKYPFAWTEEAARFLAVWTILIGVVLCTREDSHIQIDVFYLKLNPKVKQTLSIIINTIFLFFIVFLICQGTAILQVIRFQDSASLPISMMWIYLAGPLSSLITAIYLVQRIIKLFYSSVKKNSLST